MLCERALHVGDGGGDVVANGRRIGVFDEFVVTIPAGISSRVEYFHVVNGDTRAYTGAK